MSETDAIFASANAPPRRHGIEGGIDVIVIGESFDALAAAAMAGRAGLRTVLVGAGEEGLERESGPREFAPGYFCHDGEHLVSTLDPELIAALDLYRHGFTLAARRLDTVYYFSDGGAIIMPGDLYRAREGAGDLPEGEAAAFGGFIENALDSARALRPFLAGGGAKSAGLERASLADRFVHGSAEDVVDAAFSIENLKSLIVCESLFRTAARPAEPFGFFSLIRRWSGEAAGLQAAQAYPARGAGGVQAAMRRAAQAAKVDFRPATRVKSVLVEWDGAAGVETEDGAQLRASAVICAVAAKRAFLEFIGPGLVDIEFQAALDAPAPQIASAHVHLALTGAPGDERTRANLKRRLFYAPGRMELRRAYNAARAGAVAAPLIAEIVAPSAFEDGLAPANGHVVSLIVHPAPAAFDEETEAAIAKAARSVFDRMAPGAAARIVGVDTRPLAVAPSSPFVAAWSRARRLATASGLRGYYFCGPEAQLGWGFDGAAARRAAEAAIRFVRERGAAPR